MRAAWLSVLIALPLYGFGTSVLEPYRVFLPESDAGSAGFEFSKTLDETYRSSEVDVFGYHDEAALRFYPSGRLGFGLAYGSQYSEVSVDDDDDFSFKSKRQYFRPQISTSYKDLSVSSGVYVRNSSDLPLFFDFKSKWGVLTWLSVGSSQWHDHFNQTFSADTAPEDDAFLMDMLIRSQRDWVELTPLKGMSVVLSRKWSDVSTPYDDVQSSLITRADSQQDEVSFRYQIQRHRVSGYLSQTAWHPYVSIYDASSERLGWMDVRYAQNAKGLSYHYQNEMRFVEFSYDFTSQVLFDGSMTLRSEEEGFGSILGKYYTLSHMAVRSNHYGIGLGKLENWSLKLRYSRHDFSGAYTDADRILFVMNKKTVPLDVRRMDTLFIAFEKTIKLTQRSGVVLGVSQYIPTMVQRRVVSSGTDSESFGSNTTSTSSPDGSTWGGFQLKVGYEVAL